MDFLLEDEPSVSQSDYLNLAHAAIGPVAYASLGSVLMPLFSHEPYEIQDAVLIGLVSSVPSVLMALGLRWAPPCQTMTNRCLYSLGKVQYVLQAALCGATNGLGQLLNVAPAMSATHVMLASEIGVAAAVSVFSLGFLLKQMPGQCRILKAKYWQHDSDKVIMHNAYPISPSAPSDEVRSPSSHSQRSDSMLTEEIADLYQEPNFQKLSAV